ncbi:hypothetical protein ACLB2K_022245 [Fragaria x ananassa]
MDRDGIAGGLALLWDDSVTVKIRKVEQYFIDASVKGPDDIWGGALLASMDIRIQATEGQWQGLRICDEAPSISHLFFADDSMLYSLASTRNCEMIKDLLSLYERASGQQVNLQKSNVVFNGNVPQVTSQELADTLGVQLVEKHEKYLGIPTLVGRSNSGTFAYPKDNLSKKLTGWRSKILSVAERELLIKVVV